MIGHQREVLAQLGIDIWIPRDVVCQETDPTLLWRDQTVSEIMTQISHSHTPIFEKDIDVKEPIIDQQQQIEEPRAVQIEEIIADERPRLVIAPFSLQALMLPHLVILLESTEISADQQVLWTNIQRAIQAEFYELNWPFALENMDDGHGVENYIQGFIDAISIDKKVVILGKLPHYLSQEMMSLASLQEMLKEPLLKRRLWNFVQNKQGCE